MKSEFRRRWSSRPKAYKDVNDVVNVVHGAGIGKKVARLKPLGVIRGRVDGRGETVGWRNAGVRWEDAKMAGLHIRNARPSDRNAIQKVTLSAYQEYARLMPAHWEGYRENIVATLADVKPAEQIVAEEDGAIMGTVLLYPVGTLFTTRGEDPVPLAWPEVRLLAVTPAARRQGIGAALMRECVRRARRSGASVLTLHTTDVMEAAMRLYEKMGFSRNVDLDFHPAPDVTVKGYRLDLIRKPVRL